jgi:restriction system protein
MSVLQAAEVALKEAGKPLHYKEITQLMLDRGLWQTDGETPDATINAKIAVDIKQYGTHSLFQRTDKGVFALRAWGLPEFHASGKSADVEDDTQQMATAVSTIKSFSFTDAAEQVLKQFSGGKPMYYRDITRKALEQDLIKTKGLTPEATLYSQILSEIRRQGRKGDTPRFIMHRGGLVGLSRWQQIEAVGLVSQIEQHNQQARKKIYDRLFSMHPKAFEELIGQLLVAIGFEDVIVTSYSGDGGIDVRGTLVVGDVIRVNMAVQVKQWKKDRNIQRPDVQQVRGSLGTHDQGLIITTSDFSSGAVEEAKRPNAVPVALMNGEHLVALLVEYDIGVHHTKYELIELGETDE